MRHELIKPKPRGDELAQLVCPPGWCDVGQGGDGGAAVVEDPAAAVRAEPCAVVADVIDAVRAPHFESKAIQRAHRQRAGRRCFALALALAARVPAPVTNA